MEKEGRLDKGIQVVVILNRLQKIRNGKFRFFLAAKVFSSLEAENIFIIQ